MLFSCLRRIKLHFHVDHTQNEENFAFFCHRLNCLWVLYFVFFSIINFTDCNVKEDSSIYDKCLQQ